MSAGQKRQIVVFGLIFFIVLIVVDWIQFGFGPPQGVLAKLVSTLLATVAYSVILYWMRNRNNRGD